MRFRVPYWPGRYFLFGGTPHPEAVSVRLLWNRKNKVTRLVSTKGWMILLVRYPPEGKEDQWPST